MKLTFEITPALPLNELALNQASHWLSVLEGAASAPAASGGSVGACSTATVLQRAHKGEFVEFEVEVKPWDGSPLQPETVAAAIGTMQPIPPAGNLAQDLQQPNTIEQSVQHLEQTSFAPPVPQPTYPPNVVGFPPATPAPVNPLATTPVDGPKKRGRKPSTPPTMNEPTIPPAAAAAVTANLATAAQALAPQQPAFPPPAASGGFAPWPGTPFGAVPGVTVPPTAQPQQQSPQGFAPPADPLQGFPMPQQFIPPTPAPTAAVQPTAPAMPFVPPPTAAATPAGAGMTLEDLRRYTMEFNRARAGTPFAIMRASTWPSDGTPKAGAVTLEAIPEGDRERLVQEIARIVNS